MITKVSCCTYSKEEILELENNQFPDEKVVQIFKMIAHPIRLKILRLLLFNDEICTCELIPVFDHYYNPNNDENVSENNIQVQITKQLVKMKKEGFLRSRKITFTEEGSKGKEDGKWTAYSIQKSKKDLIKKLITPFMYNKIEGTKIDLKI